MSGDRCFSSEFMKEFVKNIYLSDLLQSLNLIPDEKRTLLRETEQVDQKKGRINFLKVILDTENEVERNQLFTDLETALTTQGYVRLSYLLKYEKPPQISETDRQNIDIINTNQDRILDKLNVSVLVANLLDKGIIKQSERFDIDAIQMKSGGMPAFWRLADSLKQKRDDWATVIIESVRSQQPLLLRTMGPGTSTDADGQTGSPDQSSEGEEEELDSDYEGKVNEKESEKEKVRKRIPVMKLRSYQEELADPALKGRNTIVCAETGTGKTWVALHIAREHLKSANQDGCRVVFLARTNALVKQQFGVFKKYLEPDFKIFHLQTATKECLGLDLVINKYQVFFMTPQILLNNINLGKVHLSEFSLMIFDECHHTKKKEPYNMLMQSYIDLKHKDVQLPQILGLTATIGIGNSTTEAGAVGHMLRICANLDIEKISSVKQNLEEFRQHVNTPTRETVKMDKKEKDPCKNLILDVMEKIEELIGRTDVTNNNKVKTFWNMKPPRRDGKRYQKWASRFRNKAACKLQNQQLARVVNTAMTHLLVYNEALDVNYLMNIGHVILYLHRRLDTDSSSQMPLQERQLLNYWGEAQKKLDAECVSWPMNPYLKQLRDKLVTLTQDYDNARGIIFVQTRATAFSLAEYLNEELRGFQCKAAPFTGTGSSETSQGMPDALKHETLQKFQDGSINILTATLVGSEGIDVPQCNFIITYNYTGNEANIIQMSGRARMRGSIAVHISDHQVQLKEELSLQKAIIMQNALKRLDDIQPEHFKRKIEELHTEDLVRKLSKASGAHELRTCGFDLLCYKCHRFAVDGDNVRIYGNQHRVVTDGKFLQRCHLVEKSNPSKYTRSEIKCSECELKWGTTFQVDCFEVPVLRVTTLLFKEPKLSTFNKFRKWSHVNYKIDSINKSELLNVYQEVAAQRQREERED